MTVEHPFSTMCHVHSLEIRIWHCVAVKGSPMARIKNEFAHNALGKHPSHARRLSLEHMSVDVL